MVTAQDAATAVLARQDELTQWQEDVYRTLHEHPELPNREVETAGTAADALRAAGFEVHDKIGTTGVVGILRNGDGPTVLMRADMDALPVREETGLPYASTAQQTDANGQDVPVAHACGHDVHVASLMGAARLLAKNQSGWRGTFIALFQPAEEVGTGAREMVDAGLEKLIPKPDVALAQHVLTYPAGRVGTRAGPFLSTAASMRITVHGRGSHGSMPQLSIDPVVLAAMIVVRLQAIVAREVAPGTFAVLTVGRVAAGTKSNIIPDRAVIELNIRAYDDGTRTQLLDSIRTGRQGRMRRVRFAAGPGVRGVRRVPADLERSRGDRAGSRRPSRRISARTPSPPRSSPPARTSARSRMHSAFRTPTGRSAAAIPRSGSRRRRPERWPATSQPTTRRSSRR